MMKKLLFLITTIFILASCKNENISPRNEHVLHQVKTITKGSKWTLEIGSSPEEVYKQIQLLGKEKGFDFMGNPRTEKYLDTDDRDKLLLYYDNIILEDTYKYVQLVIIQLTEDKVSRIWVGTTSHVTSGSVSEWPDDLVNKEPIKMDEHSQTAYQKILAILKIPEYSNYQFLTPQIKPLNKPYNPDMANSNVWSFSFQTKKEEGRVRENAIKLYFEDNKLIKIQNEYYESKPVYDGMENN